MSGAIKVEQIRGSRAERNIVKASGENEVEQSGGRRSARSGAKRVLWREKSTARRVKQKSGV